MKEVESGDAEQVTSDLENQIKSNHFYCPHYNILIAQEDWLYQILNYIIGRSSLRLFIIGLILNLQFHGG